MRRRSKAASGPVKTRRRKSAKLKPSDALKVASRRSSAGSQDAEVARLTRELSESLEQQTATSEVLQVIRSSPGDLQPVFETMLENAVRICDAKFGDVYRWEGDAARLLATHKTPPAFVEELRRLPYLRVSAIGLRMVAAKSVIHISDLAAEQAYIERSNPVLIAAVELGGTRTILLVPMLRENELIGAFISSCAARKFVHLPTSRLRWCRISPTRPSSPSKTCGC